MSRRDYESLSGELDVTLGTWGSPQSHSMLIKHFFLDRNRSMLRSLYAFLAAAALALGFPLIGSCAGDHPMALTVGATGHYFVGEHGRPVFWQGDTEWELFHLFSAADAGTLLERRHQQGFNVIQVMVTGVYPEWDAMKGVKTIGHSMAWRDNNPLNPDEEYFQRVDEIVDRAATYGIVLVIGVYHAADQDKGRINTRNAEPWAHWLANRYRQARNIVWAMYPHAVPASESVIRATVRGLQEGDGGAHMITMHPDPSPTSSSFMHREPWLSFNTLQTWSSGFSNYEMVAADYARTPVKPVVDGEARYEGEDGTTPLETRRAGYWACLAGGFYSFGHRDNWMSPSTWARWWDSPGADQIEILGSLFRSIDWWKLVPDPSLISGGKGDVAARSSSGDWILAYLTGDAAVAIDLRWISTSPSADAWWIDPLTGKRTLEGSYPTNGLRRFVPPPKSEDAILLVTARRP
jgi:hypothetical protein